MSKYVKETMIATGEWYEDEDTREIYWSASNTHGKRANSWAVRPRSAPLLTSERAHELTVIRDERREIEFENGVIRAAEAYTGRRVESVEVAHGILLEVVADTALRKKSVAAAKLAFQMTKAMPQDRPAGAVHIHTQTVQIANIYDRDTMDWALDASPDYVRGLVADADWTGAEELKTYAMEELHGRNTNRDE